MFIEKVKYDQNGLVPAIIQQFDTNEVLMMAYMNEESLKRSIETGKAHFWSRSRNRLWMKGESSGHYQYIKEITVDCDGDTLLLKVDQVGGACHTGHRSCFYRQMDEKDFSVMERTEKAFDETQVYNHIGTILQELYLVIQDRRGNPKEGSYTNYLFTKGLDKILKKVGEESSEVIIAAKNHSRSELTYEISDLLYHLCVLLVEQDVSLQEIADELRSRR